MSSLSHQNPAPRRCAVSRAGESVGGRWHGEGWKSHKECSQGTYHAVYTDRSEYATRTIGGLQIAGNTEGICPIVKVSQAAENPAEH